MKNEVRGHLCGGLRKFQDASVSQCIPIIRDSGIVAGCDDYNPVEITHCPFCGVVLHEGDHEAEGE